MDIDSIMAVFNTVLTAFSPAIAVLLGAVIAGAVLVWVVKRLS